MDWFNLFLSSAILEPPPAEQNIDLPPHTGSEWGLDGGKYSVCCLVSCVM